jgi:hypothetical protein
MSNQPRPEDEERTSVVENAKNLLKKHKKVIIGGGLAILAITVAEIAKRAEGPNDPEEREVAEGDQGGKRWNHLRGNWEIDGEPVSYRVSWTDIDSGVRHVKEYADIDQGYTAYEQMLKTAGALGVKWEHVPW